MVDKETRFKKVQEIFDFCFGDIEDYHEREFERLRAMQAFVYLMQRKACDIGYDDFELKVSGVHSLQLSLDLHKIYNTYKEIQDEFEK